MQSSRLLSELTDSVKAIIKIVETDFLASEETTLNYKENAERWSILECFEHLNAYNRFYNKQFESIVAAAHDTRHENEEARSNWIGRKFIDMMRPENNKKTKTLKHMNPVNSKLNSTVLDEFLSHQKNLLDILESAARVSLNETKVPVEFFRLLKMRLGDALQFVIVHEQRHLLQARSVLLKLRIPSSAALKI